MPLVYYIKEDQQGVELAEHPLASGGEGVLYQVLGPTAWLDCVAKIFYPNKRTADRAAKLQYQLEHPPLTTDQAHVPISWVKTLLYDEKGNFVGFLMPRATGEKLEILTAQKLPKSLNPIWQRLQLGSPQALRLRLKVCHNIAVAVQLLHATQRYVLVDLKPDNIIIQPNGLVTIVDTDSVEVVEHGKTLFAATVVTPEYTPCEYYEGVRPGQVSMTTAWDNFGLAVIFYRLLFGIHPFAATAHTPYDQLTDLGDKIKAGLFVHASHHQANFRVIPPPHQAFLKQDKALQQLFQQAFSNGHNQPTQRPSAYIWAQTIAEHPLLLTARELPTQRLSLENLERNNWYKLAIETSYQRKMPKDLNSKQRYWKYNRSSFRQNVEENISQLWNVTTQSILAITVGHLVIFTCVVMISFITGVHDDWYLISLYLKKIGALLVWGLKSPFFILLLFFPLIKAVVKEAKETFWEDSAWRQNRGAKKIQRLLKKTTQDLEERQYQLHIERHRLRTRIRELKEEHTIYSKVKQHKEAAFQKTYNVPIGVANEEIAKSLQSKKAALAAQDQQANQLIREEAQAIRTLLKAQQNVLAEDPLWRTIRGKNSQQKLLFLQQDASTWDDPTITSTEVQQQLEQLHKEHVQAQNELKEQYDIWHEALLQVVQEEKIQIDNLVGHSVENMCERIKIDDLLFDQAFVKTLVTLEAIEQEIEEQEQSLLKIKEHLTAVKKQLK
ncbi:MAG: hypothetical protein AB8E82_00160 [Aureispira sp.]